MRRVAAHVRSLRGCERVRHAAATVAALCCYYTRCCPAPTARAGRKLLRQNCVARVPRQDVAALRRNGFTCARNLRHTALRLPTALKHQSLRHIAVCGRSDICLLTLCGQLQAWRAQAGWQRALRRRRGSRASSVRCFEVLIGCAHARVRRCAGLECGAAVLQRRRVACRLRARRGGRVVASGRGEVCMVLWCAVRWRGRRSGVKGRRCFSAAVFQRQDRRRGAYPRRCGHGSAWSMHRRRR